MNQTVRQTWLQDTLASCQMKSVLEVLLRDVASSDQDPQSGTVVVLHVMAHRKVPDHWPWQAHRASQKRDVPV